MAEYVQHITICDRCRAGEQGEGLPFHPFVKVLDNQGKQDFAMIKLPGVFFGAFDLAQQVSGWEERDYGHVCPECAKEEAAEEAFNQQEGTVSGAEAGYEFVHIFDPPPEGEEDEAV